MLYQRIRTFLEVASCLNFSQAAEQLYISQQAVTKQIAALEQELGVKLFYRTTRQVRLTPAGSALRADFTQINRQINNSIHRARELERSGKKLLRIGFLSAHSRRDIILPVVNYIREYYPELELEIKLMDFIDLRNSLLDNSLDFCVTTSNDWQLWPDVRTTILQRKQFQIVCSARHPLSQLKEVEPDDLKKYVHLILPRDNTMSGIDQWGCKIPYSRTVLCPDISPLMVHLELGEGFALLTKVIEGYDAENLFYWNVPFPEAHAEVVCICSGQASDETKQIIYHIKKDEVVNI